MNVMSLFSDLFSYLSSKDDIKSNTLFYFITVSVTKTFFSSSFFFFFELGVIYLHVWHCKPWVETCRISFHHREQTKEYPPWTKENILRSPPMWQTIKSKKKPCQFIHYVLADNISLHYTFILKSLLYHAVQWHLHLWPLQNTCRLHVVIHSWFYTQMPITETLTRLLSPLVHVHKKAKIL